MNAVQQEAGGFRANVVTNMQNRLNSVSELQKSQAESAKIKEKQEALEKQLNKLQEDLKSLTAPKE